MAKIKIVLPKKLPNKKKTIQKKKANKKAVTVKKEIPIGPKIRLEPRLSAPKSLNESKNNDSASNKASTNCNEYENSNSPSSKPSPDLNASAPTVQESDTDDKNLILGNIQLPETISFNEQVDEDSDPDTLDTDGSYRAVRHKVTSLRNSVAHSHAQPTKTPKLKFQPRFQLKPMIRKRVNWDDEELLRLAMALQKYGFNDMDKVAEYVKTKNENEIKVYIKDNVNENRTNIYNVQYLQDQKIDDPRILENFYTKKPGARSNLRGKPKYNWVRVAAENLLHWPHIRKWRRLAFEQMLSCSRRKDYSKTVINSLLQRFYEEEEEPSDPQIINVKAMYKYLMDCTTDAIPGQLPPKESAVMSDLLKDLRLLPMLHDFSEESNFLQTYTQATQYRPFEVKDEFKKKYKKGKEVCVNSNAVKVPEEIFTNLSRHKKVVQCFNPLMIPVWMLQKEQEEMGVFSKNIV